MKVGFTETQYVYQYVTVEDIFAALGGLFTSASGLLAVFGILYAYNSSYKLSMMVKRKAQMAIERVKIQSICMKLPRIEAEI